MAARAAAAEAAKRDGRDPVAAARQAAAEVTQRERRDRSRGIRTTRAERQSGARRQPAAPRRTREPSWNEDAPVPPLTPAGSGVSHVPQDAFTRGGFFDIEAEPTSTFAIPPAALPVDDRAYEASDFETPRAVQPAHARAEAPAPAPAAPVSFEKDDAPAETSGRARNTVIFSVLTAFSRVAGLFREVLSTSFYGTAGAASAFTLAFQIPNLLRSLFADAALSAAFVPVFSDLLQQGRRKDAMKLAAELAWVVLLGLSALVAVSILLSPVVVPLFTDSKKLGTQDVQLAVHLTQIMFPVVALLGVNGLLVGILNAEDHFTVPALSPVVWNVLIMAFMVVTHITIHDQGDQLYGYAVGVLVGTIAQLLMAIPMVRRSGFTMGRPRFSGAKDPQVRQVLTLMVPVALGLGLVNFNLLINSTLGFKISDAAPRAIDAAFRLYMLPQGIFSVAIATVLFPALSRAAARADHDDLREIIGDGMRQILVLLIPAAAVTIALAAPIIRVIYQHGEFTPSSTAITADALWVFSITLPLNGLNLLLTRTFFALKDPWATTRLAVLSLGVNAVVSIALYKPLGVGGIVAGTVAANIAVVGAQLYVLHGRLGGSLGLGRTIGTGLRVLLAAAVLTVIVVVVDMAVRSVLGGSTIGLMISLALSLALGGVGYVFSLHRLHVEEAVRLERVLRARLGR
jgi:putative peptidoglycan lipid II flippase